MSSPFRGSGRRDSGYDVLIVGAGPAGAAAAIRAAGKGLRVALIERADFPRDLPGEALHPDVESMFGELGVAAAIADCGFIRYPGWILERSGVQDFIPFFDTSGHMLFGYQAWRASLDSILLAEASRVGAQVFQPAKVLEVLISADRVVGLQIDSSQLSGRYVIDATGHSQWLARRLRLQIRAVSPNLIARYAYYAEDPGLGVIPVFREDSNGWTWMARVKTDCCQYVQLSLAAGREHPPLAVPFDGLRPISHPRGADVTWRIAPQCAGAGYFLCGDAAATLDPAASSGVARALAAGIEAADLISQVAVGATDDLTAAQEYRTWLIGEFAAQAMQLAARYAGLEEPPLWLGELKENVASLQ
jgi:flavin-dependent dehydrogenase